MTILKFCVREQERKISNSHVSTFIALNILLLIILLLTRYKHNFFFILEHTIKSQHHYKLEKIVIISASWLSWISQKRMDINLNWFLAIGRVSTMIFIIFLLFAVFFIGVCVLLNVNITPIPNPSTETVCLYIGSSRCHRTVKRSIY